MRLYLRNGETLIRGHSDLSNIILLIILGDFFEGQLDVYSLSIYEITYMTLTSIKLCNDRNFS